MLDGFCQCVDSHDLIENTFYQNKSSTNKKLFRKYLTDPEEFLKTQVCLLRNWSESNM